MKHLANKRTEADYFIDSIPNHILNTLIQLFYIQQIVQDKEKALFIEQGFFFRKINNRQKFDPGHLPKGEHS